MKTYNLTPAVDGIRPWVALKQTPQGEFELVIRWILGGPNEERLPRPDDLFLIGVKLTRSGHYLHADNQFRAVAPTEEETPSTRPHKYAMIMPPQKEYTPPYSAAQQRNLLVCERPTGPIKEVCSAKGDRPAQGFGIYHLLCEADKQRQIWRCMNMLLEPVRQAMRDRGHSLNGFQHLRAASGNSSKIDYEESTASHIALTFASQLANGLPRPAFIRQHFHNYLRELNESASRAVNALDIVKPSRDLFAIGRGMLAERFEYAAILGAILKDAALVEELDQSVRQSSGARKQLRLRSMQGGNLIDFWCSPDVPKEDCVDEERGRQYPASELIGQGKTIGPFPKSLIAEWVANSEELEITVMNKPPSAPVVEPVIVGKFTKDADEAAGLVLTADGTREHAPNTIYLRPFEISRALEAEVRSSRPINAPKVAWIDYDMVRINGDRDKAPSSAGKPGSDNPQFGYGTGDGRLKILINHPDKILMPDPLKPGELKEEQTVFGFNIYGMWDSKETKRFFEYPDQPVSISELKPWLITRRYSYEFELKKSLIGKDGKPLASLQRALDDPPWMPHFVRADQLFDRTPTQNQNPEAERAAFEGRFEKLSDSEPPGEVTAWIFDLRSGMDSGKADGVESGWDPAFLVKENWWPGLNRDGTNVEEPQAYRFWVTSIDAFEQESEPVPVRTNDRAAEEPDGYIYRPRLRTPMLPPDLPLSDGDGGKRGIRFIDDRKLLQVLWRTPTFSKIGTYEEDAASVPEGHLDFECLTFRRPMRRRVNPADEALAARSANLSAFATTAGYPAHWSATVKRLEDEGWAIWRNSPRITKDGNLWCAEFPILHPDNGYEYTATVAARIRTGYEKLWCPDVSERTVRLSEGKSTYRPESVRSSSMAQTDKLSIVNTEEPRGLKAGSVVQSFYRASPILSPPGISRDLVLMKLLTHGYKNHSGLPSALENWNGTMVLLSPGQRAMCDKALERVQWPTDDRVPKEARQAAYKLLALDFGREIDPDQTQNSKELISSFTSLGRAVYRQHQTLGFRGIQRFKWAYIPNAVEELGDDESEAVRMRIYGVRVPVAGTDGDRLSENLASVTTPVVQASGAYGRAELIAENTYLVEVPADQEGALAAVATSRTGGDPKFSVGGRPALVRVDALQVHTKLPGEAGPAVFGAISNNVSYSPYVDGAGRAILRCEIRLNVEENPPAQLPKLASLQIFPARPLWDFEARDLNAEEQHDIVLPVGGGRREVFCWWLGTVSAQERESNNARRVSHIRRVFETIEPETPRNFTAFEPFDHLLHDIDFPQDPGQRKWLEQFIPEDARTPEAEEAAARVVVAWGLAEDLNSGLGDLRGIYMEREWVPVEQLTRLTIASQDRPRTEWDVILDISRAQDEYEISETDLELLAKGLLAGHPVQMDDDLGDKSAELQQSGVHLEYVPRTGDNLTRRLGVAGMQAVTVPSATEGKHELEQRPGFLDLYRENYDTGHHKEIMDLRRLYRYRIRTYIDLQEFEAPGAPDIEPRWRYLCSKPTPWTAFVRPGLPHLDVTLSELNPGNPDVSLVLPEVRFEVATELASRDCHPTIRLSAAESESDWFYRVIIKREVPFVLTSERGAEKPSAWVQVGTPIVIGPTGCGLIVDDALERDDWDEVVRPRYWISVKQFNRPGGSGEEQLIRSFEGLLNGGNSIPVRAPRQQEVGEIVAVYRLVID